jgi:hypothetical protein
MAPETTRAFLAWAVQKSYVTQAWAQACLQHGRLQAASPLADAAAGSGLVRPDHPGALVEGIRRSPLLTLLVGLALGLLLGQSRGLGR